MKVCGTCRFRVNDTCQRFPPRVGDGATVWPTVHLRDWCGEWRSEDRQGEVTKVGSRLSYQGLYLWRNGPSWLSNVVLRAGLLMLTLGYVVQYLPRPDPEGVVQGLIVYAAPTVLIPGISQAFVNDRAFGTLGLALATDVSRLRLWGEKAFFHMPNAAYSIAVAFLVGWLTFDLQVRSESIAPTIVGLVVAVIGTTALALLTGTVSLIRRDWAVPTTVASGIVLLLGGVVIRRPGLPGPLEQVSAFVPVSNGLEATRRGLDGAPWTSVMAPAVAEIALAAVVAWIGYVIFARFLNHARGAGLLLGEGAM